jgi:hypothetical protein
VVAAVKEYDKLIKSNDMKDWNKAVKIANKYFTEDARVDLRKDLVKRRVAMLMEKGDWDSLEKALRVVNKYFTSDECKNMSAAINANLGKLVDDAALGYLDSETSKKIFIRHVNTDDPGMLAKLADIAWLHMPANVAVKTDELLNKVVQLNHYDGGLADKKKTSAHCTRQIEERKLEPILFMPPIREVKEETVYHRKRRGEAKSERELQRYVDSAEECLRKKFEKKGLILPPKPEDYPGDDVLIEIIRKQALKRASSVTKEEENRRKIEEIEKKVLGKVAYAA